MWWGPLSWFTRALGRAKLLNFPINISKMENDSKRKIQTVSLLSNFHQSLPVKVWIGQKVTFMENDRRGLIGRTLIRTD